MASYTAEKGAILQPGNQINRLSSYNTEGVFGWPGFELYELVGYVKVDNLAADKADYKSFNLTVPSPDRRMRAPGLSYRSGVFFGRGTTVVPASKKPP